MAEDRDIQRLRLETVEAADRTKRALHQGPHDAAALAAGDVLTVPACRPYPVEWAFIRKGASQDRVLLVATDAQPLVGDGDLEVTTNDGSPLVLRCHFDLWIDIGKLMDSTLTGRLTPEVIAEAVLALEQIASGRFPSTAGQAETSQDPAYLDWIEDVVRPARDRLAEAHIVASQVRESTP